MGVAVDLGAADEPCVVSESPTGFECGPPVQTTDGLRYRCFEIPPSGTCKDLSVNSAWAVLWECAWAKMPASCTGWLPTAFACGPDPAVDDACCMWMEGGIGQICPGRPFVVDGTARLAPLVMRDDWSNAPSPTGLDDPSLRAALGDAYAESASFEHASVASFARFTLELLALGAPPDLVAASMQAGREEVEHARLWFSMAAGCGRAVGPGPLPVQGALPDAIELSDVLVRAVQEGCIAETVSAWQVRVLAGEARDPLLRARLRRLADEEVRHCELAWAFARWALQRQPSLRATVAAVFDDAAAHVARGPAVPPTIDAAMLRAHGLLALDDRRRLAREALQRLVLPTARALLSQASPNASASATRSSPCPTPTFSCVPPAPASSSARTSARSR